MDLFSLSCKYKIPIILAAQSNRAGGENKDGPTIDNIAESDAIAQNATRVISMKNDMDAHILTLTISKNRYGETGMKQKYDIDFGRNKYKPIADTGMDNRMVSTRGTSTSAIRRNRVI